MDGVGGEYIWTIAKQGGTFHRHGITEKSDYLGKILWTAFGPPGGPSRWSTERSGEWEPLRSELVVKVRHDHVTGDRFRHGTRLLRFRPDKPAQRCAIDQIIAPPRVSTGE